MIAAWVWFRFAWFLSFHFFCGRNFRQNSTSIIGILDQPIHIQFFLSSSFIILPRSLRYTNESFLSYFSSLFLVSTTQVLSVLVECIPSPSVPSCVSRCGSLLYPPTHGRRLIRTVRLPLYRPSQISTPFSLKGNT